MKRFRIPHWLGLILPSAGVVLVSLFAFTPPTLAQPASAAAVGPTLSVDAAAGNYPISPDIYGMNFAASSQLTGLNLPVNRWGGNSTTRYNYQNDVTNLANDWYFENAPWDGGGGTQDDSGANRFITQNNSSGAKTLLTVPLVGYVANSHHIDNYVDYYCSFDTRKYGAQTATDQWRNTCGNGVLASNGQNVVNDPSDTSIAVDQSFVGGWVSYLHTKFGTSAPENYELDNEPDLWYSTHRDVHPAGAGYDELFNRGRDYALAIKTADSNAKVFGPVSWGWTGYFYSAQDIANHPNNWWTSNSLQLDKYSTAHGGADFIPWYLGQMKTYADTHGGTRLLDYLDLHFYSAVPGVSLDSGASMDTRLRSTRSLWDPNYYESADGSWIDQPVNLIPRMHDWVNNNYPGTKLAITEYSWGAQDKIDGALAEADVLGIFGREQLDLATLWGPPTAGQPGEYAFRMYLNYDGSGGHFGDTSIQSTSTDQGRLAIYGSKDSGTGDLKLMVINKTNGALTSSIGLNNFSPLTCMNTYTYSPANLNAIVPGWQSLNGSSISYTYPAESISLLVIPSSGSACSIPVSALPAPTPTSPKYGAASYKTSTTLAWRKVKGALSYNVQVFDTLGSTLFSGNTNRTSLPVPFSYGRYTWQVQAAAKDGLTPFSPIMTFDVTLLTAPKRGAAVKASKVSFGWKGVKGASYHLEVWKDSESPANLVIDQDNWLKTSFKPLTPLAAGSYIWRVSVNGQPMPEWTFTATP